MLPDIREKVMKEKDPFYAAAKAAVFGNIIDLGLGHRFDVEREIDTILKVPFALDRYEQFRRTIEGGGKKFSILPTTAEKFYSIESS